MSQKQDNYKDLLKQINAQEVLVRTSFIINMSELIDNPKLTPHQILIFSNIFLGTVLKSYIEQHFKESSLSMENMGTTQSISVKTKYSNNNHKETLRFALLAVSMAPELSFQFNTTDIDESIKNMETTLNKTRLNQRLSNKLDDDLFFTDVLIKKPKV